LVAPQANDRSRSEEDGPALEERLAELSAAPPADRRQAAPPKADAVRGYLLSDGDLAPIAVTDLSPVTIGGHARCDIVLPSRNGSDHGPVIARIWAQADRVILHAMSDEPALRVNGEALVWAELEHGDQIEVGGRSFAFNVSSEAPRPQGSGSAP
jgi:hypothetical protein